MSVTFLIPGPLRPFATGKSHVVIEQSPTTVADALEALWKQCPGIRDRVVTEQAQVREHVNVFVGNENIRYTGGLQTPILDGAEISIIPAISGGERASRPEKKTSQARMRLDDLMQAGKIVEWPHIRTVCKPTASTYSILAASNSQAHTGIDAEN
jgi:sulfur-carrier protein